MTLTLDTQRESLRVSWFATGGAFEHDVDRARSATTETGATPTSRRTSGPRPTTPGPVYLWMVLRDNRGGIDFAAAEIDVTPCSTPDG